MIDLYVGRSLFNVQSNNGPVCSSKMFDNNFPFASKPIRHFERNTNINQGALPPLTLYSFESCNRATDKKSKNIIHQMDLCAADNVSAVNHTIQFNVKAVDMGVSRSMCWTSFMFVSDFDFSSSFFAFILVCQLRKFRMKIQLYELWVRKLKHRNSIYRRD